MAIETILLMGPPGAGKGRLADRLCRGYPCFSSISTGDLFRRLEEAKEKDDQLSTELTAIADGAFGSDDLATRLLDEELQRMTREGEFDPSRQYLLLDGYPRTLPQVGRIARRMLVQGVVVLDGLADGALIERINGRAIEQDRPEDQDLEKIHRRLEDYRTKTSLVVAHYEAAEMVTRYSADYSKDIIAYEVANKLLE